VVSARAIGALAGGLLAASGCTAIAAPPELAQCAADADCAVIGVAQGYGDCPAYACREGRCVRRGTLLPDDALLVEVDALELGVRQLGRVSQPIEGALDLVLTAPEGGPVTERLVADRSGFGEPSPLAVQANPSSEGLGGALVPGCFAREVEVACNGLDDDGDRTVDEGCTPDARCVAVQTTPWAFVDATRRVRPALAELVAGGLEGADARTVGFRGIATDGADVRAAASARLDGGVAVLALSTSAPARPDRCVTATQLELASLHEVRVAGQSALTTSGGGSADRIEATAGDGAPVVLASPSRAGALVLFGSAGGELVVLEVTPPRDVSTDPRGSTPPLLPDHVREVARIRDSRPVGDLIVAQLEASGLSLLLLSWTPPCPDVQAPLHGRLLTLERQGGLLRSLGAGEELELAAAIETSDQLTVDAALPFALTALADGSAFLLAWREGPAPGVTLRLARVTAFGDVRPLPPLTPTEQPLPRGLALRATASGRTSILLEGNDRDGTNQLWLGELCEVEPL
jgi:hypothetical protein